MQGHRSGARLEALLPDSQVVRLAQLQEELARTERAANIPPRTIPARVERVFLEREVARGEQLNGHGLARELGLDRPSVSLALQKLRKLRAQDPTLAPLRTWFAQVQRMTDVELAEAREEARTKHLDAIEDGAWWEAAACRGVDTGLFYPEPGDHVRANRAKRVCAACPVAAECLRAELAIPWGGGESHGIVGGTTPTERKTLRAAENSAEHEHWGQFLRDRALTEKAHRRAAQMGSINRAAAEFGTTHGTLRHAFAYWGLPAALPRSGRFTTREQAAEVHALALRVGIMATARSVRASHATLREAFGRFGLAWPPPRRRPLAEPLPAAFFALNPALTVPARLSPAAAAGRVRRQEGFEVLGSRVVYALGDENAGRAQWRIWHVARRARLAQEAARTQTTNPTARPVPGQEGAAA
jgi:WhiB family redox-sensing transcriptional regulator